MQLEILPKPPDDRAVNNPWQEWPKVYFMDYGQEEAAARLGSDPRDYCIMTKRFSGNSDGDVTGLETVNIKWENKDGRFTPVEIPGTEKNPQG